MCNEYITKFFIKILVGLVKDSSHQKVRVLKGTSSGSPSVKIHLGVIGWYQNLVA